MEDIMGTSSLNMDEVKLKDIFKKAIVEVLQEKKELVTELIEEALEDEALANAIKAGENSKPVSRSQVFKILGASR
jgi:hypothetical protein